MKEKEEVDVMSLFEKIDPRPGLRRLLAAVLLAVAFAAGSPALAQSPQDSASRGPTDEQEVGAFLDGFIAQQLEGYRIPGATISVVKDGEVLFARGYGQANVEKKEPVVADETLFRIASTSKLFTSTAVMQLVDEGKLDLDKDVNAYLDDVEVPKIGRASCRERV